MSEWDAFCQHRANRNTVANVDVTTANITVRHSLSCVDMAVGGK